MFYTGFAETDITPPIGKNIPGGFSPRKSEGVLDPLLATVCALSGNGLHTAVIGVDAVSLAAATTDEIRKRIAARSDLHAEDIIVAASHAHCAGPTNSVLGTDADPEYLQCLIEKVPRAVLEAIRNRQPAQVAFGLGECGRWIFNRRFKMRDGREASMPAHDDPDIVGPAGPVDPELGIIGFRSAAHGTPLGAIGSIACHPTVIWGHHFSADYPGAWRNAMREGNHPGFTLVFLNGACGNTAARNHAEPPPALSGVDLARAMGIDLARESMRLLRRTAWNDNALLATAHAETEIPFRRPAPEALDAARRLLAERRGTWDKSAWQARDLLLLAEEMGTGDTTVCPVDVIQIGTAAIAAAPWQPFSEFSLKLKSQVAQQPLLLASFANGSIGYVPTPEGFAGGGYEPTLCRGSKLAPEAGNTICGAMAQVLGKLAKSGPRFGPPAAC